MPSGQGLSPRPGLKPEGGLEHTFGRIAIAEGWATAAQVEDALATVNKLSDLGIREKLGAVMVKKGYLRPEQVGEVLRIQGSLARNRIPGFEIVSKLGQGAMGGVYKAKQLSLDRVVALKVLPFELAKDKAYIERFLREARAVARLSHPNIIQGIDVGSAGGDYYFVMEYVDGPTLSEYVAENGPLPEEQALDIAEQIGKGLEHAHKHGLVHRDVKPDNVMLAGDGTPKLCDLGLAKFTGRHADTHSTHAEGWIVGTPLYISPEQARGDEHVDIRADIYSLGATLYHMLTGKPPFVEANAAVVLTKHITELIEDPRNLREDLSEGVVLLLGKMMAKRPQDRYADPTGFLKDLKAVRRGRPPPQLRASIPQLGLRLRAPKVVVHATRRRSTRPFRRAKRIRAPVAWIAAAVVFFVGLVVLLDALRGEDRALPGLPEPPGREPGVPKKAAAPTPAPARESAEAEAALEVARGYASYYPEDFPGIFHRYEKALRAAAGTKLFLEIRQELKAQKDRLVMTRSRKLKETGRKAEELLRRGRFKSAMRLWESLPATVFPRLEELDNLTKGERAKIVAAAEEAILRRSEQARAEAASGKYDEALSLLEQDEEFDVPGVEARLRDERRKLNERISRLKRGRAVSEWIRVRGEFLLRHETALDLARSARYEGALRLARATKELAEEAGKSGEFAHLTRDMERLVLHQEMALEALQAKAGGESRVSVHKGGRGYAGTVLKVESGKITIKTVPKGVEVVVDKYELSPGDLLKLSPIRLSKPGGLYDYGILLLYSGEAASAKTHLERCLRDPAFRSDARRHLAALEVPALEKEKRAFELLKAARSRAASGDGAGMEKALRELLKSFRDTEVFAKNLGKAPE